MVLKKFVKKMKRRLWVNRICRDKKCIVEDYDSIDRSCSIGDYVVVFSGARISGSMIGAHSYVQKNTFISNAKIGKFCSIAGNVTIGLAAHPTNFISTHPAFFDNTQALPFFYTKKRCFDEVLPLTTLGSDVWIGQGAMLKAGITIGDGVIIGAGAVVVHDVPAYAIIGGVPAKILRYRFDEKTIAKLIDTMWWNWDRKRLTAAAVDFSNPMVFLEKLANTDYES